MLHPALNRNTEGDPLGRAYDRTINALRAARGGVSDEDRRRINRGWDAALAVVALPLPQVPDAYRDGLARLNATTASADASLVATGWWNVVDYAIRSGAIPASSIPDLGVSNAAAPADEAVEVETAEGMTL